MFGKFMRVVGDLLNKLFFLPHLHLIDVSFWIRNFIAPLFSNTALEGDRGQ